MVLPRRSKELTEQEAEVFLTMHLRKMQRNLNGTIARKKKRHLVALVVLLVILYGVGSKDFDTGESTITITLEFWQIVMIGFWIVITMVVTNFFGQSRFILLLQWMLVNWPLLAILASIVFDDDTTIFQGQSWIWKLLLVAECLTVACFVTINYLYPWFVGSPWFLEKIGPQRMWDVQTNSQHNWTLTYDGKYGKRHTCRYEGELNERGVPDGNGRWLDDSYFGEVLTGVWKDGVPVAPFFSRQYGTGDAFRAVPVAFFMACDDDFHKNKFSPTNEMPPRCGVVSVECSIHGSFYNNLPLAKVIFGPHVFGQEEGASIAECCRRLVHLDTQNDNETSIEVKANDRRGLQVLGHVYKPTGLPFSKETDEVVIKYYGCHKYSHSPTSRIGPANEKDPEIFQDELESNSCNDSDCNTRVNDGDDVSGNTPRLEIHNWTPNRLKEALVYVGGFKCPTQQSLEILGQFMAMTKLSQYVYPIHFSWPCGQILTYRYARAAASNDRNRANFTALLRGLAAAGIHNVHIMTHSLGVQTLMAAFQDKSDGSRSDSSQCFHLDHSFSSGKFETEEEGIMTCKTITMLNPDFPVDAFVENGFLSLRRICNHITVVGDRNDQPLYYSQFVNGSFNFFRYSQPSVCTTQSSSCNKDEGNNNTRTRKQRGFHLLQVIGRHFELLYKPEPKDSSEDEPAITDNESVFFMGVPKAVLNPDEPVKEHQWLDIDVIDTTSLDTNIKKLRHSAFTINPILLNDLEDMIVNGRRAMKRSSLLHKDGNIFSYCHAPSFVSM
eukprot:scaffold6189_cov52-Attheya_sp.AAC.1